MPKARVTTSAGLRRKFENHCVWLLETSNEITEPVASGEHLDLPALEQARTRMTIDTSKGRILSVFHPASAMDAGEILRHDAIKAFANFEMQGRRIWQVTGIAEIILLLEPIDPDPANSANQQQNRYHGRPHSHSAHSARRRSSAHSLPIAHLTIRVFHLARVLARVAIHALAPPLRGNATARST